MMVAAGMAGCSIFEPPREPLSQTQTEVLPEIAPEAPPVESKAASEPAPVRTRVAILLAAEVQSYQDIADEIAARGADHDYAIFSLANGTMTAADVQASEASWVQQLGPADYDWVFVPVLESAGSRGRMLGRDVFAGVSGYLFTRSTGELWWKYSHESEMTKGIVSFDDMSVEAAKKAGANLIWALPDNPKKTVPPPSPNS